MPKGLILLPLLLLIGGYFLFFSGAQKVPIPSLTLSPRVERGDNGYVVVVDGLMKSERECDVNGEVYINTDGAKVASKDIGPTTFTGTLPLPTLTLTTTKDVVVGVNATVTCDKDIYPILSEVDVPVPDPNQLILPPIITFAVTKVEDAGTARDVTITMTLYNPNRGEAKISNIAVNVNGSSAILSQSTLELESEERKEINAYVTTESTLLHISVTGKVKWQGAEKEFNISGTLSLPERVKKPLLAVVSVGSPSITRTAIKLPVKVTLKNSNPVAMDANVSLEIHKGDILETVSLGNKSVPAGSSVEISKDVEVHKAVLNGTAKLIVNGEERAEFPIYVSNIYTLIDPPILITQIDKNKVVVEFNNQWEENIDVVDLTLEAVLADGSSAEHTFDDFVVEDLKEVSYAFSKDVNKVTVSFKWGIESLDILIPEKVIVKRPS